MLKKKILYIKSDDSSKDHVAALLEQYDYEVVTTGPSDEAVSVSGEREKCDLLVIDLPEQGSQYLEYVSGGEGGAGDSRIPVLVLALPKQMDTIDRLLEAGCEDYLLKPIDPRLLYHRVQSLIEHYPRTYRRAQCSIVIEVSTGQKNLSGEMVEIGEGGFSVVLSEQLEMKDLVIAAFVLPGDDTHYAAAAGVVHIKDHEDGFVHGMKFEILDEKARKSINFFVACF